MVESVQKAGVREDASTETLGSCYRSLGGVYPKKRKDLPSVEN